MRTAEQGHTKQCFARTMISVIENMRDDPNYTDIGFRLDIQDNVVMHLADEYLKDGTSNCLCCDRAWHGIPCNIVGDHDIHVAIVFGREVDF